MPVRLGEPDEISFAFFFAFLEELHRLEALKTIRKETPEGRLPTIPEM